MCRGTAGHPSAQPCSLGLLLSSLPSDSNNLDDNSSHDNNHEAAVKPTKPSFKRSAAWLKRSAGLRTVSYIETQVDAFSTSCRLYQRMQGKNSCASFRREELELGDLIGQGAFSSVYHVQNFYLDDEDRGDEDHQDMGASTQQHRHDIVESHQSSTQSYVLKHLRHELTNQRHRFQEAAADLVVEATLLSLLNHPNIIRLVGTSADGIQGFANNQVDGYFLIMEQLDMTLADQLKEWRLEEQSPVEQKIVSTSSPSLLAATSVDPHWDQKLSFASQLASAIDYLHKNHLIFRDLKPDNIGIRNGTIQLFDFGLCRELPHVISDDDDEKQSKASMVQDKDSVFAMSGVGTIRYMAPEVLLGQPYNIKADVYSTAVVLYELMTLETPFEVYTPDIYKLLVCQGRERPSFPDPRSRNKQEDQMKQLIQASWSHNSVDRPTMSDLLAQLNELMHQQSKSPRGTSSSFRQTIVSSFFGNLSRTVSYLRPSKRQPHSSVAKRSIAYPAQSRNLSGTESTKIVSMASFDLS